MINNISFLGMGQKNKENNSCTKLNFSGIPNDEFVKEKKVQNETDLTKDDIVSILSSYSFKFLADDLLQSGEYSNGMDIVAFLKNKTRGKYVGMAIENVETHNVERYNFTVPEFKEMLFNILSNNIESNPEKAEEFTALYDKLLKKIETELE